MLIGNVSTFRVLLPGGCWPCGARAVVVLLFSPLFFYEFSIKAAPQSPPGVQRSLLTLSGGLDAPPVDVRTFSYAWIAWAVQRGHSRPNRSQIAAVFHFGIEIFLLSKRPCSTFPELCACARWFAFMHAIAGRSSARALRLTSSWPVCSPEDARAYLSDCLWPHLAVSLISHSPFFARRKRSSHFHTFEHNLQIPNRSGR